MMLPFYHYALGAAFTLGVVALIVFVLLTMRVRGHTVSMNAAFYSTLWTRVASQSRCIRLYFAERAGRIVVGRRGRYETIDELQKAFATTEPAQSAFAQHLGEPTIRTVVHANTAHIQG